MALSLAVLDFDACSKSRFGSDECLYQIGVNGVLVFKNVIPVFTPTTNVVVKFISLRESECLFCWRTGKF